MVTLVICCHSSSLVIICCQSCMVTRENVWALSHESQNVHPKKLASKLPFASISKGVFLEGRTGSMARFTNGKNRGSKYKNFVFPNHDIKQVRYSLMTCSYARNSVWRKQNRAWKSQGFLLQIAYLSHFPQMTLTIRKTCVSKSRRIEW